MSAIRIRLLGAGALLLCLSFPSRADNAGLSYPEILLDDVGYVLTAPTRWQEEEWRDMGLAALGIAGVAAYIDRPLRDEMRRHAPNDSRAMLEIERFGKEYSLALLGGYYLAGVLGDDDKTRSVAEDGLAAIVIASGIIMPTMKYVTGRSRPRDNDGIVNLHWFSKGYPTSNSSFPSGHATQAFAVAAVFSDHYDKPWVTWSSYTLACLVGVARSYHDAHFASDILAGALIGTLVGKSVVAHNKTIRSEKITLRPDIAPGLVGLRLERSF